MLNKVSYLLLYKKARIELNRLLYKKANIGLKIYKDLIKRAYDGFNRSYNIKKIATLRKLSALGWLQDGTNITNRFALLMNNKSAEALALLGAVHGVQSGAAGPGIAFNGFMGYNVGKTRALQLSNNTKVLKLPDFDPKTGAYIGSSYKIPVSQKKMQLLHQRLLGKSWQASAPDFLDWLIGSKKKRIHKAIIKGIIEGKANTKELSSGLLASLVFPYIYKKDGSVVKRLGFWRWNRLPTKGILLRRPINLDDIQLYNLDNLLK